MRFLFHDGGIAFPSISFILRGSLGKSVISMIFGLIVSSPFSFAMESEVADEFQFTKKYLLLIDEDHSKLALNTVVQQISLTGSNELEMEIVRSHLELLITPNSPELDKVIAKGLVKIIVEKHRKLIQDELQECPLKALIIKTSITAVRKKKFPNAKLPADSRAE